MGFIETASVKSGNIIEALPNWHLNHCSVCSVRVNQLTSDDLFYASMMDSNF